MLIKIALLAVVCFAMTMGGIPYGGPMPGGPGGMPGGGPGGMPGGGLGGIPGGVGQCLAITSFHQQVANFAVNQLGTEYSLRRIMAVRSQVVQGSMYHLKLHVNRNTAISNSCETCEVRVWEQLNGNLDLQTDYTCSEECCH